MSEDEKAYHPGEFIREELRVRRWSWTDFSKHAGLSLSEVQRILCENGRISIRTAHRLAACFGTGEILWLNLWMAYKKANK